jgi:hypothetical protein
MSSKLAMPSTVTSFPPPCVSNTAPPSSWSSAGQLGLIGIKLIMLTCAGSLNHMPDTQAIALTTSGYAEWIKLDMTEPAENPYE